MVTNGAPSFHPRSRKLSDRNQNVSPPAGKLLINFSQEFLNEVKWDEII
jgi:hypothetical protein